MQLYLYRVHRTDRISYDEAAGFVIRAEGMIKAREIAVANCGCEGPKIWRTKATCQLLGESAPSDLQEVILRDYRAG